MNAPLIGFEGPIAAGKTTLAKLFAQHTGYQLILENFDNNEFLADFYADRDRWALPMQLWFLNERHRQFDGVSSNRRSPIVADYTPLKNDVFASMLLRDREWRLYSRLSATLTIVRPIPDVIVYLNAPNDVLLHRIRERCRDYEAHIDSTYLNDLRNAYETRLAPLVETAILRRDTSTLALSDAQGLQDFFSEILHLVAQPT